MRIADFEALLSSAKTISVLTGAGVSQESGVPTFRGTDGLWNRHRPEELATPEAFAENPMLVWEWYVWRRQLIHDAQPNAAHLGLVRLEAKLNGRRRGKFFLITQNVDGLHERAGSLNVIRLHGDIWRLKCSGCGAERQDYAVPLEPLPPRCSCSAMMRPGVVWFGEPLPEQEWQRAAAAAASSELFLVIGTSALVQPAASLPLVAKRNHARLIEINPTPTPLSKLADHVIQAKAAEVFSNLSDDVLGVPLQ